MLRQSMSEVDLNLCRSQNVEEAARYWQGTPAPEEPLTRRGSTDADVPEYRASPTQASERDFASTTRGAMQGYSYLSLLHTYYLGEGTHVLVFTICTADKAR